MNAETERALADRLRMIEWLALAALFYGLALTVFGEQPQLQTLAWKFGNLTSSSFIGYWCDRRVFWYARMDANSPALWQIRRAIIIGAAMLTVGLGL